MGGLLKTVVLPYFACLHAYTFASIFLFGRAHFAKLAWPDVVTADSEFSTLESHLLGAFGAFHAAIGFGCAVGFLMEHSHFRAVMTTMELILWSLDGYDAIQTKSRSITFFAVNVGIAAVGLFIHSQEPGVFTKDHNKEKKG
jgi:hypothetical protein